VRQRAAMSVLESVSEILRAIPAIQAAEVQLDEKHGIDSAFGLRLFDPKSAIRMLESNHEAEKLKRYLSTIDYETLLKLEALMRFGRDRDATFAEKVESCRRRKEARSDIVRTLLEKVPACGRYFSDAVERLREEGADVNSL
jgi:hypothetical protein